MAQCIQEGHKRDAKVERTPSGITKAYQHQTMLGQP